MINQKLQKKIRNIYFSRMREQINNIVIKGLLDQDADVAIITPEFWHVNWPFQEAHVQFQRIGTLSQVKQSMRWAE